MTKTIAIGSVVQLRQPPLPKMTVVDIHADQEKLREDPLNPVIVAECQWETPEVEEGMGPVRHTIFKPLAELEELTPAPSKTKAAEAAPAKSPKPHQGPKEDPAKK